MEITHVLRAQEWLSSTPLHVILYDAFGWKPPEFCHLPMVVGADGKKLSKRHGSTSVEEFRKQGYLPEALINYIAMVGASYEEDRDMYTLDELVKSFSLDKLNKASGVFDYKKLDWFNGQYIRLKNDRELAAYALPWAVQDCFFDPAGKKETEPNSDQYNFFVSAIPLVKERAVNLIDISAKLKYLFLDPEIPPAEEFIPKKSDLESTIALLERTKGLIKPLYLAKDDETAEEVLKNYVAENKLKLGDIMMPLRVALTGSRVSPPLFGSIRLLGVERSLARIKKAIEVLSR
jgi:glutamyl-tRNA synthetase